MARPIPEPAPVTIATGGCPEVLMGRLSVIVEPTVSKRPLSSTVVGSYPQPEWLIDRDALGSHAVPRVRVAGAWRIPEAYLAEAQDDATVVAIREMEHAGIDTITDGEIRRESYSNRFATALDGVEQRRDAAGIAHIRQHRERLRAGRHIRQGLLQCLHPPACQHHAVACAGQPCGDRASKPRAGAGDDRDGCRR